MNSARTGRDVHEQEAALIPPLPGDEAAEQPQPWEQIEAGRYMPRRIRGSFRGRVLG